MSDQQLTVQNNGLTTSADNQMPITIEQFTSLINKEPKKEDLTDTFDKKAKTLPISFVETLLDELYLRQWGTENVQTIHIANEILVTLTLWVIDPFTKVKITRAGFAAAAMQWDAVPDDLKWTNGEDLNRKKERNAWGMDLQNKKQESLKLVFPKVKSMAIKNAAQSLGKSFGRDLNRKHEDTPTEFWTDLVNSTELLAEAKPLIEKAKTKEDFETIWESYSDDLKDNIEFKKHYLYYYRNAEKTWK